MKDFVYDYDVNTNDEKSCGPRRPLVSTGGVPTPNTTTTTTAAPKPRPGSSRATVTGGDDGEGVLRSAATATSVENEELGYSYGGPMYITLTDSSPTSRRTGAVVTATTTTTSTRRASHSRHGSSPPEWDWHSATTVRPPSRAAAAAGSKAPGTGITAQLPRPTVSGGITPVRPLLRRVTNTTTTASPTAAAKAALTPAEQRRQQQLTARGLPQRRAPAQLTGTLTMPGATTNSSSKGGLADSRGKQKMKESLFRTSTTANSSDSGNDSSGYGATPRLPAAALPRDINGISTTRDWPVLHTLLFPMDRLPPWADPADPPRKHTYGSHVAIHTVLGYDPSARVRRVNSPPCLRHTRDGFFSRATATATKPSRRDKKRLLEAKAAEYAVRHPGAEFTNAKLRDFDRSLIEEGYGAADGCDVEVEEGGRWASSRSDAARGGPGKRAGDGNSGDGTPADSDTDVSGDAADREEADGRKRQTGASFRRRQLGQQWEPERPPSTPRPPPGTSPNKGGTNNTGAKALQATAAAVAAEPQTPRLSSVHRVPHTPAASASRSRSKDKRSRAVPSDGPGGTTDRSRDGCEAAGGAPSSLTGISSSQDSSGNDHRHTRNDIGTAAPVAPAGPPSWHQRPSRPPSVMMAVALRSTYDDLDASGGEHTVRSDTPSERQHRKHRKHKNRDKAARCTLQ